MVKSQNKNLFIIALIAIVNALGYGIIIPVLYSYSQKFGMSDFENGLLFALFSICQFIATPLIGRMSDKYGRRPLLIASIAGTALSFFMMAFAPSAIFVFLARALDGITAGNIPVASAVISDTTEPKDRAKGFAIIGASFGFGFVFGPGISALTVGYGMHVPFIIAGIISIIAVVLTALLLPETNKHMGEVKKGKLFDFSKLFQALFDENVGMTLLITLIYWFAFGVYIYAFQPFAVKSMHMSANQISIIFTGIGIIGLIAQAVLLAPTTKKFGEKNTLYATLLIVGVGFSALYFTNTINTFYVLVGLIALANSYVNPLLQTILSRETDAKSQGSMMGLSASYQSIGMIFGPIIGGAIATQKIDYPFILCGVAVAICFFLSFQIMKKGVKKESAF